MLVKGDTGAKSTRLSPSTLLIEDLLYLTNMLKIVTNNEENLDQTSILKQKWFGCLTQWNRVMHICISKLTIIGSDNGLLPGLCQAITWTNAGILLIEPLRTKFSEIIIGIPTFSFKKMRLQISSAKWRPFCLDLSGLLGTRKPM